MIMIMAFRDFYLGFILTGSILEMIRITDPVERIAASQLLVLLEKGINGFLKIHNNR